VDRTAVRALAPLALMGLIFYLSAQQQVGPELPAFTRVIAHFTEYAVLASLWIWALVPEFGRRGLIAAVAISALYAAGDEWHQSFVEGRDSDPVDWLIDCAGIMFAVFLSRRPSIRRAASRRRPTSR
jgi:VanZ family protein